MRKPKPRDKSLANELVEEAFKKISSNPRDVIKRSKSLLLGNRGKDYISLVRQGKKLGELLGKTFEFWELCTIFANENIVLGFDETFLRVGEKEAERVGDKLFSGKAKVRSADLLSPVRCNVVTQFAVKGDQKPSEFLEEFVNKAVQRDSLSYVVADAGFLNLEILKELPAKAVIRGKTNLKGVKELFAQSLTVKYYTVEDRTYVAHRKLEYKGLYYYDVIYVKHKGKPTHFVFVSNVEGDPYELAETYRLRYRGGVQDEESEDRTHKEVAQQALPLPDLRAPRHFLELVPLPLV
ncbi:hypothetical protein HS7_13090 [Sulfolobales archaeon HS-7]|nr:hypothetical protein HS7_13090 [Sulfolobales archaeon HS-7]